VLSHRHGDSVCLNCFVLFRSPITGQSNLMTHAKGCWKAQYIDSMDLGRDMGVNDCVPVGVQLKARHDGCAKRHSYLAASAIAYHGGVAASARPERTFRDVGFINNVLRQRMKPEMISRAARLRRNRDLRIPIPEIVRRYNAKHPNSKRRGAKRTTADADSNEVVDVTD
jgi:hypothetical protein